MANVIQVGTDDGHADTISFYRDRGGKWRWRKTAPNGRIVLASTEGYDHKDDAVKNMQREVLQGWIIIEEG